MDDLTHSHGFDPDFHLAGLDLGEIEQAIDEVEKTLGVIEEILDILSLQWRDLTFGFAPQQTRIANDRAERGAEFMVYIGEKLRLVLARLFELDVSYR